MLEYSFQQEFRWIKDDYSIEVFIMAKWNESLLKSVKEQYWQQGKDPRNKVNESMFKDNHLDFFISCHALLYHSNLKWLQEFFYHNMGEICVFHENIVKLLDCVQIKREKQSVIVKSFNQMKLWERNFPQVTDIIPRMEPKEEIQCRYY